jgi:hypothetical protein
MAERESEAYLGADLLGCDKLRGCKIYIVHNTSRYATCRLECWLTTRGLTGRGSGGIMADVALSLMAPMAAIRI